MKRVLSALAVLLLSLTLTFPALAQLATSTVTGTIYQPDGTTVAANTTVMFNVPQQVISGEVVQSQIKSAVTNAKGAISINLPRRALVYVTIGSGASIAGLVPDVASGVFRDMIARTNLAPILPTSASNGGTGIDSSASTGVPMVSSGTWSINPTTGTGTTVVLNTSPTLTTPDINAGTVDSLTSLSIRSTGAAFDMTLATDTVFTAGRTVTIRPGDAARIITLSGDTTLSGTNTGDQTITLTGDVTGSGTGSFATTIGANKVTLGMMNTGTAGNLITYSAAGAPAAVATGTSGQFLTSNGAGAAPTFTGTVTGVWTFNEGPVMAHAAPATPTTNKIYKESIVRGWVETSGAGAWTIDADFNVTSITDNAGVGDFTINWATAFASTNYAVVGTVIGGGTNGTVIFESTATAKTASLVRMVTETNAGSADDPTTGVSVMAIGG